MNTTKTIDENLDINLSRFNLSIKQYRNSELRIIPPKPTEIKIINLFKTLSCILKLYFLFKIKLIVIPKLTLIMFEVR